MLSIKERLRCVKQTCSRTIQTSGADCFVRGAHHRRCAREGLTGAYDALFTGPVASSQADHRFPLAMLPDTVNSELYSNGKSIYHRFGRWSRAVSSKGIDSPGAPRCTSCTQ